MTFFHLLNCAAVTCAPFFITYKCTMLSEYNSFWRCVQAGSFYVLTQLVKLLILATFFPVSTPSSGLDPTGGLVGGVLGVGRASVDLLDLAGLYLAMEQLNRGGKAHIKFMVAGVGWASAEALLTKFLALWFGARGLEFDWKYLLLCLDSNLSLMQHVASATFIWLWTKQLLGSRLSSMTIMLLLATCYKPLILDHLKLIFSLSDWSLLGLNGLFTFSIALSCLYAYVCVTKPVNGSAHK